MSIAPTRRCLLQVTRSSFAAKSRSAAGSSKQDDPMDLANWPDDVSSLSQLSRPAILNLEEKRTLLHYKRLVEAELPVLAHWASQRRQFSPPPPSHSIQVRTQHYQGESHPVDRKVSITFNISQLPLPTDEARHKFRVLVGKRADGDLVKISCERFPTRSMNEVWCSDVLDKLIQEAKNTEDSMLDIPVVQKKKKSKRIATLADFPTSWLPPTPPPAPTPSPRLIEDILVEEDVAEESELEPAAEDVTAAVEDLTSSGGKNSRFAKYNARFANFSAVLEDEEVSSTPSEDKMVEEAVPSKQ